MPGVHPCRAATCSGVSPPCRTGAHSVVSAEPRWPQRKLQPSASLAAASAAWLLRGRRTLSAWLASAPACSSASKAARSCACTARATSRACAHGDAERAEKGARLNAAAAAAAAAAVATKAVLWCCSTGTRSEACHASSAARTHARAHGWTG
eukprot:scaffold1300_cov317-Prasinococcus_capsulatus_cf.AAC.12